MEWIRITTMPHAPLEHKLSKLLRLSRAFLKTDVAILAKIRGDLYEIFAVDSPKLAIEQGQQFELALTYCEKTIQSPHVTSFHQACNDSLWSCHPAYKNFKLESYIGIPIHLEDGLFGTLGFSSTSGRTEPFTPQDHNYVQMTARWMAQAIEENEREQKRKQEIVYLQQSAQKARQEVVRIAQFQQNLLGRIKHDLSFPLQGLASMSSELAASPTSITQARDRLRTINETSKHLLSLLDSLANTVTLQPCHGVPPQNDFFSPHDMIEDIASVLSKVAQDNDLRLDVCLDATLPEEVCGDLSRYHQIITNLIRHSIQTSTQGHIFVCARMTHATERAYVDDDVYSLLIEIEDTSPHLPCFIKSHQEPVIDRSFARSRPQKDLMMLSSPSHDSLVEEQEDGMESVALEIASYLLQMMDGNIDGSRRKDAQGNVIRVQLPIKLTAASFESTHVDLERYHIWSDTKHEPLKLALSEACERFDCRLVDTLSEAHICLVDHDLEDLEGRLSTYRQLAPESSFYLLSHHPPEMLPQPLQGVLDRTLRHRQLLDLLRMNASLYTPTTELTLSTINMVLLEDDPEALIALHPSTSPDLPCPIQPESSGNFDALQNERSHMNLVDLSRRITDLGSSALNFAEEDTSPEQLPLDDCAENTGKHGERTTVGVPNSLTLTTPLLFDRSVRERHRGDLHALELYDTLLQEFFVHSARWLTEIRGCTNARIMQQRLNQDLIEIKETAREIGLLAISQLCFQMLKGLKSQSSTRFTMLNQLDDLSACMNRSYDETKAVHAPPPPSMEVASSYIH